MNLEEDNLFFTHVGALWGKRAANFRRDKKAWMCTTILPSMFVLAGLLIFSYAGQDRALEPLELKLEDYNKDVKSQPRNPITVNNVNEVFHCQPGVCSYTAGSLPIINLEYNSFYALCGSQSLVNADVDLESLLDPSSVLSGDFDISTGSFQSCSVDRVAQFMETITEAGVELIEVDVNTAENVSFLVCLSTFSVSSPQPA